MVVYANLVWLTCCVFDFVCWVLWVFWIPGYRFWVLGGFTVCELVVLFNTSCLPSSGLYSLVSDFQLGVWIWCMLRNPETWVTWVCGFDLWAS